MVCISTQGEGSRLHSHSTNDLGTENARMLLNRLACSEKLSVFITLLILISLIYLTEITFVKIINSAIDYTKPFFSFLSF